jgi:hypothetical protein
MAARSGLSVRVANGDRVVCPGVCPALPASVQEEPFKLTCYILPLDGFDVVLGVQWLRTLGPILWDFEKLTMTFWSQGRTLH